MKLKANGIPASIVFFLILYGLTRLMMDLLTIK